MKLLFIRTATLPQIHMNHRTPLQLANLWGK